MDIEKPDETGQTTPPTEERLVSPKQLEISERQSWMMDNMGTFTIEFAMEKFNRSRTQIYDDLKEIREIHTQKWPDEMARFGYVAAICSLDKQLELAMEKLWIRVNAFDKDLTSKASYLVMHLLGEIKNIAYARKELLAGGTYKGIQDMVKNFGGFSKET